MKRVLLLSVLWYIALAACMAQAAPQAPANSNEKAPKYDVSKEIKVKGTVQSIKNYDCPISGTKGYHVVLKNGQETIEVHIAAEKFMKDFNVSFTAGDQITIYGNRVDWHGEPALIVRQIDRNNDSFYFRNGKGDPLW